MTEPRRSPGLVASVAFFVAAGVLEVALPLITGPAPGLVRIWEAAGRGTFHFLLAFGLWNRVALCRSIAMVYCLAALTTYGAVLALALTHAPFLFPQTVVLGSLFEVPSCALLYPWLRSPAAAGAFTRPLLPP
jgi:hypothetical protein